MVDIVDAALEVDPSIHPTLFVDDLTLEADGDEDSVVQELSCCGRMIMLRIAADGMEVNKVKSLISASHPAVADRVAANLGPLALTVKKRVKGLGVGMAAGTSRNVLVQNARLKQFKKRIPRFRMLRRANVDTARVFRTGGSAALMHGQHTIGVAPSTLQRQRRLGAAAMAPAYGLGGQELDIALMVADGSPKGRADPAFEGHTSVILHWAQAIWNLWLPVHLLQQSLADARVRLANAKRPWSIVYGPAAAVLATLKRVGWIISTACTLTTDTGQGFDMRFDPPVVIARGMNEAVRRWRWRTIAAAHPSLSACGANIGPIFKLLSSRQNDEDWGPLFAGSLKSVLAGRQFPQIRCFQAGWSSHSRCIFCLHMEVTNTTINAAMPENVSSMQATGVKHTKKSGRQQHDSNSSTEVREQQQTGGNDGSPPPASPLPPASTSQPCTTTPLHTMPPSSLGPWSPSLKDLASNGSTAEQQRGEAGRNANTRLAHGRKQTNGPPPPTPA